jgi:hypothetical protein
MSESDELTAAARTLVPADRESADCWRFVIQGLEIGWLDDEELVDLARHLREGRDFGVEELLFAHLGDRLRVSFLDDAAECEARDLGTMTDALVAQRAQRR